MVKVCIVGAGPSGLVAAKHILQKLGTSTSVTIFDAQPRVGGLWPLSPDDTTGHVHPLMVANQSRHTVQFSDHAWDAGAPQMPRAWQVGRYVERYAERYLRGRVEWRLGTRVLRATRAQGGGGGWRVVARREADGVEESYEFGCLVVASGFFGRPVVDEAFVAGAAGLVPLVHSSRYRDLKGLFGGSGAPKKGGRILVVGGQMSGVEIAGTIAAHISTARHSPDAPDVDADSLTVHHLVQQPVRVFPLYTSPNASLKAASFLPIDMPSNNISGRPTPFEDIQGHTSEDAAQRSHWIHDAILGGNQAEISPVLAFTDPGVRSRPPFIAISDHYLNFVREGLITVQGGRLASIDGARVLLSDGSTVEDVAAVVLATGFDASPSVDFLPDDVLRTLAHDPSHRDMPLALAFHGTHHPDVPNLGFVGFYRGPFWGVMEMQARFLATLWSPDPKPERFQATVAATDSIRRTLMLRGDPRCSQFPMGDYIYLMAQFSEALSLPISEPSSSPPLPPLPHNNLLPNVITPARYSDPNSDPDATAASLKSTHETLHASLTTPKFVARAIFRSLLGTWTLHRRFSSRLPSYPSGVFNGTATFSLRAPTRESRQCVADAEKFVPGTWTEEYLYAETGVFRADGSGLEFPATRRYVWRYDETRDVASVWFVKPDDARRVDYLFHELALEEPADRARQGWRATAGHLCVEDFYDVGYEFVFGAVNLERWTVQYGVKGPAKDYTITGEYRR